MASKLYDQVWQRAKSICEYCQMPQKFDPLAFEIDHIIPQKDVFPPKFGQSNR